MARVSEQLRDWLARAEMLARGLDGQRRHALEALESGRPWDARADALQILGELPRSPVALALWADAAEALMLDHEAAEALERLVAELPFRADVWLRLASVARRLERGPGSERLGPEGLLERAAGAGDPPEAADAARLMLFDGCLERGELEAAERWLDQLGPEARQLPESRRRMAELALEAGEPERARRIESGLPEPAPIDGRGWLLRGRLLVGSDEARAAHAFARALLLDAPGAERAVSHFVAGAQTPELVAALSDVVQALGRSERPLWRAALASQRGQPGEGLAVLAQAARQRDAETQTLCAYAEAAIEQRDRTALTDAWARARRRGWPLGADVERFVRAHAEVDPHRQLALLDEIEGRPAAWAAELRTSIFRRWLPAAERASWRELLQEAARLGDELGDPGIAADLRALALDPERPLRVAVIGEFNAGKSTFINALLGEAVAPTGVLPTTATVNHVVWGTEKIARIDFRELRPSRSSSHSELGQALAHVDPKSVERVEIRAPLELLRSLEIIDTPGFNAPERAHALAARAAIGTAHVVLWLLDAAQPFKESERAVGLEVSEQRLPLFVLINKRDRLAEHETAAVQAYVAQSLAELAIRTEHEPVLFSARQGLSGRTGDTEALAASNFGAVLQLIDQLVAARSHALREHVLRQRFRRVLQTLHELAERAASDRRAELESRRAHNLRLLELARSVRERRATLSARLTALLDERVGASWPASLGGIGPVDSAERRLIAARARAAFGDELTTALLDAAGAPPDVQKELRTEIGVRVGALVAALAPALARPSLSELAFGTGGRATVIAHLSELAVDELLSTIRRAQPAPQQRLPSRAERRLQALLAALECNHAGTARSQ